MSIPMGFSRQFILGPNSNSERRVADRCSNGSLSLHTWVQSTYMCGTTDYKWIFEEMVNGGTPSGPTVTRFRCSASNLIQWSSFSQLQWGNTCRVKIAPVYGGLGTNGVLESFGNYQNVCISNLSMTAGTPEDGAYAFGRETDNSITNELTTRMGITQTATANIYPNPNSGNLVELIFTPNNRSDRKEVDIRMFDSEGREVLNQKSTFRAHYKPASTLKV